jgi:hypothetical protein
VRLRSAKVGEGSEANGRIVDHVWPFHRMRDSVRHRKPRSVKNRNTREAWGKLESDRPIKTELLAPTWAKTSNDVICNSEMVVYRRLTVGGR